MTHIGNVVTLTLTPGAEKLWPTKCFEPELPQSFTTGLVRQVLHPGVKQQEEEAQNKMNGMNTAVSSTIIDKTRITEACQWKDPVTANLLDL